MSKKNFPALSSIDHQPTQRTLQVYAQVLGKIRRALAPPQRHWAHVSLRVGATGLTTTPIPVGSMAFEMQLNLISHRLGIVTSQGTEWKSPLYGQSAATFCEQTLAVLAQMEIHPEIDCSLFADTTPGPYHAAEVERYWQAITQIDAVFKKFKGALRGETSDVQLWPHHIDLAFLWFTGRQVPGVDPEDEENADEQMNFGFSPGDDTNPNPYFYITAYPTPGGLTDTPLPNGASWHAEGFSGAMMNYDALVDDDDAEEKLLNFLRTVQQAGAGLMK